MKKILICLLVLALAGVSALAEVGDRLQVSHCNEYVTLREEPSTSASALDRVPLSYLVDDLGWAENGFRRVAFHGKSGYILSKYLETAQTYDGTPVELSRKQRYNVNLFLSNFTEAGFLWSAGCYDANWTDATLLTDFAVEHCWFNRQNRLDWGDYFNYNNVRLPEDQIKPVVRKYFGVNITPSHSLPYVDYRDGYYYWQETGGHTSNGFACLNRVEELFGGRYAVWFTVLGMGESWDNDVCYYTYSQAAQEYPPYSSEFPEGFAIIDLGGSGLDDRSNWTLERYAIRFGD